MRAILACGVMLLLAGCHQADRRAGTSLSKEDAEAAAVIDKEAASNSLAAAKAGLPVPAPSDEIVNGLPTAFVGTWGMTKPDCDPHGAAVEGRLEIAPTRLSFYESKGKVIAIDHHSPHDVTVTLDMTGEGQHWTDIARLKLDSAGIKLDRIERSPARTFRYQRC